MSDTESDYSRSPRAFDGETASESTTEGLDSADFEETERGAPEVSTDSGSTSSVEVVSVNGARPSTSGRQAGEAEEDVSVADPGEGLLTMRIPGPLESLSNPTGETVFFTDVFKHGLRLPLRHSVQKILAAIGYAPGQFNPNFWITLLGTITAFGIAAEGEPSYEQFAHLYSVTRTKSTDQGGWVQSNCLAAGQRGHFVVGVPSSQKTWRRHRVLVSGAWESASGVIVERRIPTTFQMIGRILGSPSIVIEVLSLKRPIATRREVEVIERVRSLIPEEDRFHKTLLDYKNLFRAGLISEPEYLRRKKEEEEKEKESKRRLEARAAQKKARPSKPKAKTPRPTEGGSAQASTPAEWRREKRVAEAELIREAHLQVTGKRVIEGPLDVTPLPKRPRGPNEDVAVLVPDDEEDAEAGPVNIACPRKVANMEMWLGMKRAENAAKIADLSSKLAEAERAAVDAEEARARAEAAKEAVIRSRATEVEEAKKQAVEEYRTSEEFTAFLDKEVMGQCEDLIYRFKRFNADKKLNLNFLRDPPSLPERVTEEMVEAYLGEDAEAESSSGSESGSEDEEEAPPPEPSSVREAEAPVRPDAEDALPTP
ncbi:unnamed protein product [Prunus brigantina]